MITRRTLRRHHLFRPDEQMRSLFVYALAVSARKHGIVVHVATLMSTHEHLVVTDVAGVLPDFLRDLHRWVALGTKVLRRWEGPVWDHEPSSIVVLRTRDAVVQKSAYAIANPVLAGLVREAREWPGVQTRPRDIGRGVLKARRPAMFFDPENEQWPESVELELSPFPSIAGGWSAEEMRRAIEEEVARQEREARAEVRSRGAAFLGARRCQSVVPHKRARSHEPVRKRNPTFAVGRGRAAELREAVLELREFRRAYHDAMSRWRAGDRAVTFPAGTWSMSRTHGVVVGAVSRAA
ncbi:Transposase [Sandaracinus amylolyticus]|uniref:Transposase n=1 Tax=Sandaracinus amylolyticus TaxID=927083 RepID=A0A0F6YG62_9BACT|nr:Transposase [Sandaracinus amylolyticus]